MFMSAPETSVWGMVQTLLHMGRVCLSSTICACQERGVTPFHRSVRCFGDDLSVPVQPQPRCLPTDCFLFLFAGFLVQFQNKQPKQMGGIQQEGKVPASMSKHCGLSEFYVHYGWCLEFPVSIAIVFSSTVSLLGQGQIYNNFEYTIQVIFGVQGKTFFSKWMYL